MRAQAPVARSSCRSSIYRTDKGCTTRIHRSRDRCRLMPAPEPKASTPPTSSASDWRLGKMSSGQLPVRFSTTGANMVSRTKERALDPLLVPALPALATPSICWLRSAAASDTLAQHPCSSTAVRATAGSSARASELSNLAPRLRPARRTVAG
jgi:hypothetical protein